MLTRDEHSKACTEAMEIAKMFASLFIFILVVGGYIALICRTIGELLP